MSKVESRDSNLGSCVYIVGFLSLDFFFRYRLEGRDFRRGRREVWV